MGASWPSRFWLRKRGSHVYTAEVSGAPPYFLSSSSIWKRRYIHCRAPTRRLNGNLGAKMAMNSSANQRDDSLRRAIAPIHPECLSWQDATLGAQLTGSVIGIGNPQSLSFTCRGMAPRTAASPAGFLRMPMIHHSGT